MKLDEDRKRKRAERFGLPPASEDSSILGAGPNDQQTQDLTSRYCHTCKFVQIYFNLMRLRRCLSILI
jgi:hypothetical protein